MILAHLRALVTKFPLDITGRNMTKILRFIPLMILAILIPSFVEVDITLPGFPQMAKYFNASVTEIQWTLIINFIGLCAFTLFYGPLSDSFGRKKILYFGCGLFCIASIGCLLVNNLFFLYICRFLQGFGCSAIWVVGFVIASDVYKKDDAVQVFGVLNAAISASLTIAPMVGSFIAANFGWKATYLFVVILSFSSVITVFFLPETNPSKKHLNIKTIAIEYGLLLSNRKYLVYALTPSLLVSGLIAYISTIPFLYLEQLHVPFVIFALYQAIIGSCLAIVGSLSGKIYKKIGAPLSILLSIIICASGCLLLLVTSIIFPFSAISFTLSMSIICIGSSIQFSMVFAKSLDLFPQIRGSASSLITFMRLILFSISVTVVGKYYTGKLYDSATVISGIILCGLILSLYVRHDLKQNLVVDRKNVALKPPDAYSGQLEQGFRSESEH